MSVQFYEYNLGNEERQNISSIQMLIPALTVSPIKDDPDLQ